MPSVRIAGIAGLSFFSCTVNRIAIETALAATRRSAAWIATYRFVASQATAETNASPSSTAVSWPMISRHAAWCRGLTSELIPARVMVRTLVESSSSHHESGSGSVTPWTASPRSASAKTLSQSTFMTIVCSLPVTASAGSAASSSA